MLVKDTLDFEGNFLRREILSDEKPDLTSFINFHADKLVEMTLERSKKDVDLRDESIG